MKYFFSTALIGTYKLTLHCKFYVYIIYIGIDEIQGEENETEKCADCSKRYGKVYFLL